MIRADTLITVASIIAGFGVTVLMFRLQRELAISDANWSARAHDKNAPSIPTWLPVADLLVVGAVLIALLLVVTPVLLSADGDSLTEQTAWCAVAIVLLAGYVPAILAHYRFIFWLHLQRSYFQVAELVLVFFTVVAAWMAYASVVSA